MSGYESFNDSRMPCCEINFARLSRSRDDEIAIGETSVQVWPSWIGNLCLFCKNPTLLKYIGHFRNRFVLVLVVVFASILQHAVFAGVPAYCFKIC